jgi:predicted ester cyclase
MRNETGIYNCDFNGHQSAQVMSLKVDGKLMWYCKRHLDKIIKQNEDSTDTATGDI